MRRMLPCLLLSCALGGCLSNPREARAEPPPASAAGACPLEKIRVTQATGCRSDGSLEFCVPKDDAQLVERLRALGPEVRAAGGGGRAGCDMTRETLYFFETDSDGSCVTPKGAMTDAAWAKICRIAAEPAIRQIVPTWYE